MLDVSSWKLDVLRHRWQRAWPFHHLVLDNVLEQGALQELVEALEHEDAERSVGEIYELLATPEDLSQPALIALKSDFESDAVVQTLATISGRGPFSRVSMRGYAYGPGHYLLPHADRDADESRLLAYALYLHTSEDLQGGDLELIDCSSDERGEIVATRAAGRIQPRPGRLVLMETSDASLHRVHEVTRGRRVSLSGWLYR